MATREFSIQSAANDAYWSTGGSLYTQYTCHFGVSYTTTLNSFFNFQTSGISQGDTIGRAIFTGVVKYASTAQIFAQVYGNDVDDAVSPTTAAGADALALTTAKVPLEITEAWAVGDVIQYDITDIIQEIVNRPGFIEGNRITILFKGISRSSSFRSFQIYGRDSPNEAKLKITYGAALPESVENIEKGYFYKLFDINGTFLGVLDNTLIKSVPNFTWNINSGMGNISIDLAAEIGDAENANLLKGQMTAGGTLNLWDSVVTTDFWDEGYWDYTPGAVTSVHSVECWVTDGEATSGELLWSGILKRIQTYADASGKQGIAWHCYSWITEAVNLVYEDASNNTTITFNSADPSDMFRDIIDRLNAKTNTFTYDTNSIQDTGTKITYTFKYVTCKEALDKALELCPGDWFYYIDQDNKVHLKHVDNYIKHRLYHGVHFNDFSSTIDRSNIINRVYFKGGDTGGGTDLYKLYTNSGSVSAYGNRELLLTDSRVTVDATAQSKATKILDEVSAPLKEVAVNVIDNNSLLGEGKGYDIESLSPGDNVVLYQEGIANIFTLWDSTNTNEYWDAGYWDAPPEQVWGVPFKILSVSYSGRVASIEIREAVPSFEKRQEDLDRNIKDEQSINIPNAPT